MLLDLLPLTAAQQLAANTPEIGAESTVRYTDKEFLSVLELTNVGVTATDEAQLASSFPIVLTEERHIHLRCDNGFLYDTALVLDLDVTLSDDSTIVARATMEVPTWAKQGVNANPVGTAVDFRNTDGTALALKVKSIQGINAMTGGRAGNINRVSIWSSPDVGEFVSQGCVRNKNFDLQIPGSINIACGYNAQQFVKQGRSEEVDLTLEYTYFSSLDGIGRLNGSRCGLLIDITKDDTVPWERLVLTGHRPNGSPNRGDGDDEVLAESSGPYESFLVFNSRG